MVERVRRCGEPRLDADLAVIVLEPLRICSRAVMAPLVIGLVGKLVLHSRTCLYLPKQLAPCTGECVWNWLRTS